MINPILFHVGLGTLWLVCGIAQFHFLLPQVRTDGESKGAAFVGSLVFWPIMLPIFMLRIAWLAALERFEAMKDAREVKPLKSGTDNGLYEPVPEFE